MRIICLGSCVRYDPSIPARYSSPVWELPGGMGGMGGACSAEWSGDRHIVGTCAHATRYSMRVCESGLFGQCAYEWAGMVHAYTCVYVQSMHAAGGPSPHLDPIPCYAWQSVASSARYAWAYVYVICGRCLCDAYVNV